MADVFDVPTEAAARAMVEAGDADTAFVIPQGFTAAIESGHPTTLAVVGSRTSGLATDVAKAVAARFGEGVAGTQLAVSTVAALAGASLPPSDQQRIAEAARTAPPPVAVVEVTTELRALDLADLLQRLDGDPVPVLLGAVGPAQRVRGAAPGDAAADPRRRRSARARSSSAS